MLREVDTVLSRGGVVDGTKPCSLCKSVLPVEEFFRSSYQTSGYSPRCKTCIAATRRNIMRDLPFEERSRRRRMYEETYRTKHPERYRQTNRQQRLKRKFGMTWTDYCEMLDSQGGVCAICHEPPTEKLLAVDHDHSCCPGQRSCGKCLRGLLCARCNTAIGLLKDDADRARTVAAYLESRS